MAEELTLTQLIDKVLDASGMKQELESEKSLEAEIRLENLEEFKSITKSFEEREGLISLEDFLGITKIFSKIIDGKSKFTAKHSKDLEEKSLKLVEYFNLDEETKLKIQIASNLHDIGKLGTPNSILDKDGTLSNIRCVN